ncbi:GTPase ObgE [Candidatus Hydrogenedentota bacterium]
MFVDRVRIMVTAGRGGDGVVSFRREKFVAKGGPDGGDGGKGGDVVIRVRPSLGTLADFRAKAHVKAGHGGNGRGSNCHGKNGKPAILEVPPGTLVFMEGSDVPLCDLNTNESEYIAVKGGMGGKGNARFTSSTRRVPRMAERGEPGETLTLVLELKLIADVGLVGKPNAGKSTLLSRVSAAKPEIANYPFTTLTPHLGVVDLDDANGFVLADIPGLIEGASEGIGLGHEFLRHIERTRVLVFVLDLTTEDPLADYDILAKELRDHDETLSDRPRIIALNKIDMPDTHENKMVCRERFKGTGDKVISISALTGKNVLRLMYEASNRLAALKANTDDEEAAPASIATRTYRYKSPFEVEQVEDRFVVTGEVPSRWMAMTDMDNKEAVELLHHRMTKMGIYTALRKLGAGPGDIIEIRETEFEAQMS